MPVSWSVSLPADPPASSVPVESDGARVDPRLIPLLDYLAKLFALECRRQAQAAGAGSAPAEPSAREDGSS